MRHIAKFESHSKIDEILDKISNYGISSLNDVEKEFLDTASTGVDENEIINKNENPRTFEDDFGLFKFEYEYTETVDDVKCHVGVLYVPNLDLRDGRKVKGRLEGKIVVFENGQIEPEFYSIIKRTKYINYTVFDFCSGIEYELDSFLDDIVEKLKNEV